MPAFRFVAVLAITAATTTVAAQSGPVGALNGRVVDQSRAAIPGVCVTAVNVATNDARATLTNGEGVYQLAALSPGTYDLTFQLDGFKTVTRPGGARRSRRSAHDRRHAGSRRCRRQGDRAGRVAGAAADDADGDAPAERGRDRVGSDLHAELHALLDGDCGRQRGHPARRRQRYRCHLAVCQRHQADEQQRALQRRGHHQHAVEHWNAGRRAGPCARDDRGSESYRPACTTPRSAGAAAETSSSSRGAAPTRSVDLSRHSASRSGSMRTTSSFE